MDESELAHACRAVVEVARSLLDGRADFFEAVRAIARHAYTLDPDMKDDELWGFVGIDSQTDHLAVGRVLEEWHPSVREKKRAEIIDFEQSFRADALRDAATLVERYGRAT